MPAGGVGKGVSAQSRRCRTRTGRQGGVPQTTGKLGHGEQGKGRSEIDSVTGSKKPSFQSCLQNTVTGSIKFLLPLVSSVFTYPENGTDDLRDQAKNLNHQVFMGVAKAMFVSTYVLHTSR